MFSHNQVSITVQKNNEQDDDEDKVKKYYNENPLSINPKDEKKDKEVRSACRCVLANSIITLGTVDS